MTGKRMKTKLALTALGGLTTLLLAGGPAQANLALPNVLTSLDTTATLSGQASVSLAVVASASTTGNANVKLLGATGNVVAAANVKVAADARINVAYSLKAGLGTLAYVGATPGTPGCIVVVVSATAPVSGNVKATVVSGGTSTVVEAVVNTAGAGSVANVVVCAQV